MHGCSVVFHGQRRGYPHARAQRTHVGYSNPLAKPFCVPFPSQPQCGGNQCGRRSPSGDEGTGLVPVPAPFGLFWPGDHIDHIDPSDPIDSVTPIAGQPHAPPDKRSHENMKSFRRRQRYDEGLGSAPAIPSPYPSICSRYSSDQAYRSSASWSISSSSP
jgi:hypothetical protein